MENLKIENWPSLNFEIENGRPGFVCVFDEIGDTYHISWRARGSGSLEKIRREVRFRKIPPHKTNPGRHNFGFRIIESGGNVILHQTTPDHTRTLYAGERASSGKCTSASPDLAMCNVRLIDVCFGATLVPLDLLPRNGQNRRNGLLPPVLWLTAPAPSFNVAFFNAGP